jgi:hypothetical protein
MLVLWRETFMNEVTILGASEDEIKAGGERFARERF